MTQPPHVLNRRALYNLLRFQALESQEGIDQWQIEDYRQWTLEKLFEQLSHNGWQLDRASFCAYAECVKSPQELLELLIGEGELNEEQEDKAYLILFELWRRLMPYQEIFEMMCDEIDYQMYAYEIGEQADQKLEAVLSQCVNLLYEQGASVQEAKKMFASICQSCAQDLESFLYDFISDQIEAGALAYAQELYHRFYQFVRQPTWFDLLKVRWSDNHEARLIFQRLYKTLELTPDVDVLFEALSYLSEHDVCGSFNKFFSLATKLDLEEEDRHELSELASIFLEHTEGQSRLRSDLLSVLHERLTP